MATMEIIGGFSGVRFKWGQRAALGGLKSKLEMGNGDCTFKSTVNLKS